MSDLSISNDLDASDWDLPQEPPTSLGTRIGQIGLGVLATAGCGAGFLICVNKKRQIHQIGQPPIEIDLPEQPVQPDSPSLRIIPESPRRSVLHLNLPPHQFDENEENPRTPRSSRNPSPHQAPEAEVQPPPIMQQAQHLHPEHPPQAAAVLPHEAAVAPLQEAPQAHPPAQAVVAAAAINPQAEALHRFLNIAPEHYKDVGIIIEYMADKGNSTPGIVQAAGDRVKALTPLQYLAVIFKTKTIKDHMNDLMARNILSRMFYLSELRDGLQKGHTKLHPHTTQRDLSTFIAAVNGPEAMIESFFKSNPPKWGELINYLASLP